MDHGQPTPFARVPFFQQPSETEDMSFCQGIGLGRLLTMLQVGIVIS